MEKPDLIKMLESPDKGANNLAEKLLDIFIEQGKEEVLNGLYNYIKNPIDNKVHYQKPCYPSQNNKYCKFRNKLTMWFFNKKGKLPLLPHNMSA